MKLTFSHERIYIAVRNETLLLRPVELQLHIIGNLFLTLEAIRILQEHA